MRGSKKYDVDPQLWTKINWAIRESTPGISIATMLTGMCNILQATNEVKSMDEARVMLAAMVLSPGDRSIGSLADKVPEALALLRGKRWLDS